VTFLSTLRVEKQAGEIIKTKANGTSFAELRLLRTHQ
jgi:hypothetical protein